jgi:hypothetical protein
MVKHAQKIVDHKQFVEKQLLAQSTANLYDRQIKGFASSIFDQRFGKRVMFRGG